MQIASQWRIKRFLFSCDKLFKYTKQTRIFIYEHRVRDFCVRTYAYACVIHVLGRYRHRSFSQNCGRLGYELFSRCTRNIRLNDENELEKRVREKERFLR